MGAATAVTVCFCCLRVASGKLSGMKKMLPGASALLLVAVAACGEADEPSATETNAPVVEAQTDLITPARYQTSYTFVSFAGDQAMHLRLLNRTSETSVVRDYRGWTGEGDDWRPVLAEFDTLPAPRMAWRVTPAGPLRLMMGEDGEVESIQIEAGGTALRLTASESSGEWLDTGAQGESIRLARLDFGDGSAAGLLLTLRSARRHASQVSTLITQVIFATDTLGNGILIARTPSAPDEPATAWTYFDGVEADWTDGEVHTLSEPEGAVGRWSLQLPEANIAGEFAGTSIAVDDLTDDSGARVLRVEGSLLLGEESRQVSGVSIETHTP